jgi:hypothetical protein
LFKDVQSVQQLITRTKRLAEKWGFLNQEIIELFLHGIDASQIVKSRSEIDKTIQSIELNTSRISLGAQRIKLQDLMEKLKRSDGDIANKIRMFLENIMGDPEYTSDEVIQEWQGLVSELNRINEPFSYLHDIENVADKISESGAPIWSKRLISEPLLIAEDELTPLLALVRVP